MHLPDAVSMLERELAEIFGVRMLSFVVYGLRSAPRDPHGPDSVHHHGDAGATHTLAVIDGLSTDDLRTCSKHVERWQDARLATPLFVGAKEFARSLDAFPFEFGAILADHVVVSGANPFEGLSVNSADLRHACEVQARGHLLHLRQGYVETRGRSDALAFLIVQSAPAFAALISSVAKLDGGASAHDVDAAARAVERRLQLPAPTASEVVALVSVDEIPSTEAERLFPAYLDAVERLVAYVDRWAR